METCNIIFNISEKVKEKYKDEYLFKLHYSLKNYYRRFSPNYYINNEHIKFLRENRKIIEKDYDCSIWLLLTRKSYIYFYTDEQFKKDWNEKIDQGKFLEVNIENIISDFKIPQENKAKMIYYSIIDLFKLISFDENNNKPIFSIKKLFFMDVGN